MSTITHRDRGQHVGSMDATAGTTPRKRGWRRGLRSITRGVLILVLVLASTALVTGAVAKARLQAKYPPLGQLVDVGGYRLHVACQGTGSPTVIMEAGAGGFSLHWSLVQPVVAQTTRVCVYDRAGLGWSDRSPKPRTLVVMAEELATLLTKADISGPYVLVGHSIGGAIIRQFAIAHPQDVVGMVLVDSATEQQVSHFPGPIRNGMASMMRPLHVLKVAAATGLLALHPTILAFVTGVPQETAETIRAIQTSSGNGIATFMEEMEHTNADTTPRVTTLGNIALVVLRHGRWDMQPSETVTAADVAQYEATWVEMQDQLAALSPRGRLVVAERSGHDIHLEQPDLVISAIQDVLTEH